MHLTAGQTIITVILLAAGTVITRFISFVLFPEGKSYPKIITYLGKVLPPAMIGLLVIYSLKNVSFFKAPYALPEVIASVAVLIIHFWKRNVLLSIAIGTALYMFLVQVVF